jgi:hypothetical protein
MGSPGAVLPELASVHWRKRTDERELVRAERLWTATTLAHSVPFVLVAALLVLVEPLLLPVALAGLAQAWIIPELYAHRGASVVRSKRRAGEEAERRALGLMADLLDHEARDVYARTGLALERGRLGVWVVGEAGALLVRPGGRRVHCYCVRVPDPDLPSGDRVAHLLLALRADEHGFATVANRAFTGARWRVRRRLAKRMHPALALAAKAATLAS